MSGARSKCHRQITIPDDEIKLDTISLDEARKRLIDDIGKIDIDGAAKVYLLTYPSGIGKTHHIAEYVKTRPFIWLCAIHDLARETMKAHFKGGNVVELKSRKYMIRTGEMICPFDFEIMNSTHEDENMICKYKCHRRCKYYRDLYKSRRSNGIFGMHAHLQLPEFLQEYIEKSDCMIIDESFSNHYIGEWGFHEADIERLIELLYRITQNQSMAAKIKAIAESLIEYLISLLQYNDSEFSIDNLPVIDRGFKQMYYWELKKVGHKDNVMSILQYAYKRRAMIVKRDDYYTYIKVANLPENIPIIILDASGSVGFYEKMLNRNVIAYGLDQNIKQFAQVTQFIDGVYTLNTLLKDNNNGNFWRRKTYDRLVKLIQAIKYKHFGKRIVIGTKKPVEIKLRASKIEDENTKLIHFYDIRGINDFMDYDVLIILGIPMLSFKDVAREARLIFKQDWDDDHMVEQMLNDGKTWVKANYAKDGIGYEIHTFKFSNDHIQQYYEHSVIAELSQMLGRIRPFDENDGRDKYVYIITNTPIPQVKIDKMITIKEFMQREGTLEGERIEIRKINEAIKKLPDEFKVQDLADKIKEMYNEDRTGERQRRNLKALLRRKRKVLNIIIENGKHTIRKVLFTY